MDVVITSPHGNPYPRNPFKAIGRFPAALYQDVPKRFPRSGSWRSGRTRSCTHRSIQRQIPAAYCKDNLSARQVWPPRRYRCNTACVSISSRFSTTKTSSFQRSATSSYQRSAVSIQLEPVSAYGQATTIHVTCSAVTWAITRIAPTDANKAHTLL